MAPSLLMAAMAAPALPATSVGPKGRETMLGAVLAPEPFKSHADWCQFGAYGGLLSDGPLLRGNERWALLLCSEGALRALKEGDLRKACFIASWAAGYMLRRASIARAGVWRNDFSVISRLPSRYWDVRAPTETSEEGRLRFFCPPPDWGKGEFEKHKGEVEPFLRAALEKGMAPEGPSVKAVPSVSGWSANDAWLVASWAAEVMALELFDLDSVRRGRPRFCPKEKAEAVRRSEGALHVWLCACYLSYLADALRFEARGLDALTKGGEGGLGQLVEMGEPFVLVPKGAPPGVERAAHLLAVEFRAEMKRQGKEAPPLWRMVRKGEPLSSLPAGSTAVVLATPGSKWAKKFDLSLPEEKRGVVAFVKGGLPKGVEGAIFLVGNLGVLPHLVDFLLDRLRAPLWGGAPPEKALGALKAHWAGWKLLRALEGRRGEGAVEFALKVPFRNSPEDVSAFQEEARGLERRGMADFWDALIPLPTPGGAGTTWDFVKREFLRNVLKEGSRGR